MCLRKLRLVFQPEFFDKVNCCLQDNGRTQASL